MILNHVWPMANVCSLEPARLFFEFHCRHNDSPLGVVEFAGDPPGLVAIVLPCLLYITSLLLSWSILVTGWSNGSSTCSDGWVDISCEWLTKPLSRRNIIAHAHLFIQNGDQNWCRGRCTCNTIIAKIDYCFPLLAFWKCGFKPWVVVAFQLVSNVSFISFHPAHSDPTTMFEEGTIGTISPGGMFMICNNGLLSNGRGTYSPLWLIQSYHWCANHSS